MPSSIDTFCYGKSRNRTISDSEENKQIFKTKIDILNCKPEDVKLKMEGNRVIIEGALLTNTRKEKPVHFTKHYIMPENCDLSSMKYTISPDGVFITATKKDRKICSKWPKLEEDCTTNCVDSNDRFDIRLDVQEFRPEDIKIKVNGNTITIKAKHLQETGMKKVIKTYSLPENCEITKLERKFTREGHLILSVPKFLGLFCDSKNKSYCEEKSRENVKCKFNITIEKFEIKIDVSNFRPEDINIIQQKRMVTVEGKSSKKFGCSEQKFEKTFVLPPDYDITKIDRKFHSDGVLVITVPRMEGTPVEYFKTFLPENAVCDMQINEYNVEIHLDISGYSPEEIILKVVRKNTIMIEGKQIGRKGNINKSFMKSYILPPECDTRKIKKHIHSNGVLTVRIPRNKKSSSLENLSDLSDQRVFSNGTKNGSLDNLSEPDDYPMVDSAELDQNKFEMKFNVQDFQTDDIYVKINKNIVTIECRHPNPKKGIVKSYLVPKAFDLEALHTYITHDDILIVSIPRLTSSSNSQENHNENRHSNCLNNKDFKRNTSSLNNIGYKGEKIGDNYVINVDIRGYNNNDISLDIKGQTILVQGGHLGNRTISRSFSKKFTVPPNYNVEDLIYYISAGGSLVIEVPRKTIQNQIEPPQLYKFPNDFVKDNREDPKLLKNDSQNNHSFFSDKTTKFSENVLNQTQNINSSNSSPYLEARPDSINKNSTILIDENGNEIFQIKLDVTNCKQKEIDVKVKNQNLRIEGKKDCDEKSSIEEFSREFIVPEDFNVRKIKSNLTDGMLFLDIPKKNYVNPDTGKSNERDIISNVIIGKDNIILELDSSGRQIEDFSITTDKNILSVELSKGSSSDLSSFKTKVDLPEDSLIDDVTKNITAEGKLLVKIPRKYQEFIESNNSHDSTTFIEHEIQKPCLVSTKSNMGQKSKSVKFLVDDFESDKDSSIKFATLPRSSRSKSYNNLFLENNFREARQSSTTDGNFELKIFVPHHEPDEVVVKVRGNTITIEGKKKNDIRNTYFSKNFFKTYIVPKNIDADQLKTIFLDNYLIISAPKRSETSEAITN